MEIGVKVIAENVLTGEQRHTNSCYLTYVALDDKGAPTQVPPVVPETTGREAAVQPGRQTESHSRHGSQIRLRCGGVKGKGECGVRNGGACR